MAHLLHNKSRNAYKEISTRDSLVEIAPKSRLGGLALQPGR
jgi:hypothetical protein